MRAQEYLEATRMYRMRDETSLKGSFRCRDLGNGRWEAEVRDAFGNVLLRTDKADALASFLTQVFG